MVTWKGEAWNRIVFFKQPVGASWRPCTTRTRPVPGEALEYLCESYWYPLYVFVRRQGYPPDDAQDVVQGFFEELFEHDTLKKADREKSRFSSFLLICLRRYILTLRERAASLKRGGGQQIVHLDVARAEECYGLESARVENPEQAFERHWALAVVERVARLAPGRIVAPKRH